MLLNKKISIVIITLVAIFFLYTAYNTITKPNKAHLNLHPPHIQASKPSNINEKIENNIPPTHSQIPKEELNEANTAEPRPPEHLTLLIEKSAQQKIDLTTVLKIDDLPTAQQAAMKEWLSSYQEKGYIATSDVALDHMELKHNQANIIDLNDQSIQIPLQDIEKTALSEYEYKGAILDQIEGNDDLSIQGVKRLYIDKSGNEISLHEKLLSNTSSIPIKEFISDNINGYPAVSIALCTESNRCVSKITIITKNKSYEIMAKGNQETTKKQLVEIARTLDLPKLQTKDKIAIEQNKP